MTQLNKQKTKKNDKARNETKNNNKKHKGSEKNRLKGLKKVEKKCLLKELNKEYETTRLKKIDKKTRHESIIRMYNKCKNNFVELCTKRSSSKIIQCMIKYAEKDIVEAIYNEIKEKAKEIICRPFGGHVFEKLYKFDSCKKLIRENTKYLVTDRIGIEFINNIYKNDKNVIEGVWHTEKTLTSEKIGMVSVREIAEKIIKKEMLKHEIAHDLVLLCVIGYKCKAENGANLHNYHTNYISAQKDVNLQSIISTTQPIDIKIYESEITYTNEEKALYASCVDHFPDLLTTRSGTILAMNTIKIHADQYKQIFEQIVPYFLKIVSNEYAIHFIIHYYNAFDKECIHKQIDILFFDMFINEFSVLLLAEMVKNEQYEFTDDKIDYLLDNYTDYIRNHNWVLVHELAKKNDKIKTKSIEMIQKYNENNILNDAVALNYFLKLEQENIIDLKNILGAEYKKYNKE